MPKKLPKGDHPSYLGNHNSPFSALLDDLDPERAAQRQEYLRRIGPKQGPLQPKPPKKILKKSTKGKGMSFDEKLERTQKWLVETFPELFDPSQPPKSLDVHIVRDIKQYYKQNQMKEKYPPDLVIKAALHRYMQTPEYLACLVDGARRYNIKGQIVDCGSVLPQESTH